MTRDTPEVHAVTTTKKRLTLYLTSDTALEALFDAARLLAPLELRGQISRSTITEAALLLAWQDWQARGVDSELAKRLVTLPYPQDSHEVTP